MIRLVVLLLVQVRVAVELGIQIEPDIIAPAAAACESEDNKSYILNPYLHNV